MHSAKLTFYHQQIPFLSSSTALNYLLPFSPLTSTPPGLSALPPMQSTFAVHYGAILRFDDLVANLAIASLISCLRCSKNIFASTLFARCQAKLELLRQAASRAAPNEAFIQPLYWLGKSGNFSSISPSKLCLCSPPTGENYLEQLESSSLISEVPIFQSDHLVYSISTISRTCCFPLSITSVRYHP